MQPESTLTGLQTHKSSNSPASLSLQGLNLEQLRQERARRRLLSFIEQTKPDYVADPFHEELCRIVERFHADVVARRRPRVIIVAPPQHGKSEIVSRKYPAWALGRNPNLRIIAGSYSSAWADTLSTDVQRTMDSEVYNGLFPETRIAGQFAQKTEARRTADYFEVADRKGFYRSAGRGVGVTGRSADILLIDDPNRSAEDAMSETIRESTWQWWLQDLYSRLQQGAGVLLMSTRWHTDDLIGRLIEAAERGGDSWDVHVFPALSESGEALAPSRYDRTELEKIQATQPAAVWNALYQGSPVALKGNILEVDRWRYYGAPGQPEFPAIAEFDLILISCDASFKDAAGSDFCALQTWGIKGAQRWLFADGYVLARLDYPRFKQAVRDAKRRHPYASRILIEAAANGEACIAELKGEISGITAVKPEGGKISRAWAASGDQSSGFCFLPDRSIAPWVSGFVNRCALFPANIAKAGSDDDIDAFTQAINWARVHAPRWGLVEFLKAETEAQSARMQATAARLSHPGNAHPENANAASLVAERRGCPECAAACIAPVASGGYRCGNCGHQFGQAEPRGVRGGSVNRRSVFQFR
ncbi:MAG TPA: phage terminase large subunit [Candidatus Limnocylindrales bacterium]|nr:phage terminase large subunit [Candidatus Limnocylindrales bacterium]